MNQEIGELPLLTFSSLYNLLREEKTTKSLQKLPNLFYNAFEKYLDDKNNQVKMLEGGVNPEKLKKEVFIIKKSKEIFIELINIRCLKISNISIKNTLFDEDILSKENILEKEMVLFGVLNKEITKFKNILG